MERTLRLGEWTIIGRGWLKKKQLMYAGESGQGMYSVALEWTNAHNSAAFNLYFGKNQQEFQAFNGTVKILDVNQNEMKFKFEK